MTEIVARIIPESIAALIEANINDYLLSYARLPGAVLHADEESIWVEAGMPAANFNAIVWARF